MSRATTPVPAMKGCLKSPVPTPGPMGCVPRKCVAFGEEEEVYVADVWDRTPTEPARKLSYQDLLELKEIQRSLPRAQQLPDPISGKPPSYLLDHVPIGLLPLLPAPSPARKSPAHPPSTCPALPPAPRPRQPPAPSTAWVPPHMQHLVPTRPPPQPHRPAFAFLPLLDARTRSPSPDHDADADHDPPTPSLTNASLDSSPLSRASDSDSSSPEPPFLALEPPTTAWHPFPSTPKPRPPPRAPPPRRRNVMILNGIEVPIDDDDDDEPVVQSSCAMDLHCFAADIPSPWAG